MRYYISKVSPSKNTPRDFMLPIYSLCGYLIVRLVNNALIDVNVFLILSVNVFLILDVNVFLILGVNVFLILDVNVFLILDCI